MPYLPTTQAYLEQSALLLQAYPDTRITTKYHFPRPQKKTSQAQKSASQPTTTTTTSTTTDAQAPPAAPIASLTLKTYNPTSGICLKYRTNKAAEVGRLITSLGKLAGGADVASLGLSSTAPVAAAGDVEMTDVPEEGAAPAAATPATATTGASGKGGKGGKKKGGKGKR